ncbi:hypothetical protein [Sphingomonas xinjiangensis]|uniref:Membrane-bound lysozyme-inhibitor of c-type lysozyme n=1 Tax=Sphingomonas xinjiangensis TaxID=643568 RepID=A0A840YCG5_9SPHN|nr:hypothetical protein [Sphingomonas xinjiangensis]MBB5711067.1 hypothetical protein [Sphingomonas xinjiangensis]
MPYLPLALIVLTAPVPAQSGATIPAKFRGEWARTLADCRARGGENSAGFTVAADMVVYYEDSDVMQQVRLTDPNTLTYKSKFVSADGEEPSEGTLRLSADGKRMLGSTREEDLIRCPG